MVIRYHEDRATGRHDYISQIFIGRLVHSKSLEKLEILGNAVIGVQADGTIAFVHESNQSADVIREQYSADGQNEVAVVQLQPTQFLFPGMVDTHLHAPQWPNLALGMEGTLRDWVENWTDPIEASYCDTDKARRVYADVAKTTLKLGSTTVAYNSTIHSEATNILAHSCFKAGQRAIIGKMSILQGSTHGNWEESRDASLHDSEKSVKYIRRLDPEGRLIQPCVQPRGGPYCPPKLMYALGQQSKDYRTHVQAHMCETLSDIERTLELHKSFDCYSDMYKANGLLHNRSILAHCIHLQPKDLENLKQTEAGVAHNPNSNTCLRDGECRVRELLDHGIKVGLGTDCSAGYMPSIQDAMRNASNVSRHLALHLKDDRYTLEFSEIVYLATLGGARVLGMDDQIGSFEAGKKFDALVIDFKEIISVDEFLLDRSHKWNEAMVKKWVFLGDDRNIRKVYVDGQLVAGHDIV